MAIKAVLVVLTDQVDGVLIKPEVAMACLVIHAVFLDPFL